MVSHLPRKEMAQLLRMSGCSVDNIAAFVNWDHSVKVDTYLTWPGPDELAVAAGFRNRDAYMVPRLMPNPLAMPGEFRDMAMDLFKGLDEELQALHEVSLVNMPHCCELDQPHYIDAM